MTGWTSFQFNFSLVNIFYSRLGSVMCMGVTAGAYILTLFAVSLCGWYLFTSAMKL